MQKPYLPHHSKNHIKRWHVKLARWVTIGAIVALTLNECRGNTMDKTIGQRVNEIHKDYNVKAGDIIKVYGLYQDKLYDKAIEELNIMDVVHNPVLNNQAIELTGRYFRMKTYLRAQLDNR